ncbi:MAG: peptidase C14, partial [Candidatus Electrothrix sp. AR1]|nr:peptidase C14 [Candidatus Electrothrix sp. AR1]
MADAEEQKDRGSTTDKARSQRISPSKFRRSLAIIIGIDQYTNNIPQLSTAANDARELKKILEDKHGYEVIILTDEKATKSGMEGVFLDKRITSLSENDRLLFYFAGHGIALDGEHDPKGYLIPQDAQREDSSTFWPMIELHNALDALSCRHMLAILDCCFAGAFRWSSKRAFQPLPEIIYKERYDRFIRDPAWQAITSAAYDQEALDTLSGYDLGVHGFGKEQQQHSPFALALFEALDGAADTTPKKGDGVITVTELISYLQYQVGEKAEQIDHAQIPQLWPLNRHEYGEFIFLVPDYELNLPPAPNLTEKNNPYKGLYSYENTENDIELFFGRTALIEKLQQQVEVQPFTVVLGASGTGKSSLIKAGLLPALEKGIKETAEKGDKSHKPSWFIPKEIMRPGADPLPTLHSLLIRELPGVHAVQKHNISLTRLVGKWAEENPGQKLLLVIDQFEELITLCQEEKKQDDLIWEMMHALKDHHEVLRIVLTLRSDFEAQISQTDLKEYWQDENR